MRTRSIGMIAGAAALALGLSACGSDSADTGSGSSGDSGGKALKIGIKFDQPGLGLKQGSEFTGLDVDVAKYVAKELGTAEGDIQFVQAPSAQRETLIETGQVDMVVATYSITDARKEKVSFAGPYFIAGLPEAVRGQAQGRRSTLLHREVRHWPEEGRHRSVPEDHRRDQQDDQGRVLAEGRRRQPRQGRVQAGRGQPAHP